MGNFDVEMSDTLTPITSGNFIDLVDSGYYDGVIFHRVIDNFMIQGGDPTGTGSGGPGYTIPDEFDSTGTLSNIQKTISMANSGPNTGGSQFFINLVNNTYLDFDNPPFTSKHPVFGMVIDSFEVVQEIGGVPVNSSNRPLTDVVMDSIRVSMRDGDTIDLGGNNNDTIDTVVTGIQNQALQQLKINVFPNPIGMESVITMNSELNETVRLTIIDPLGHIIISKEVELRNGMNRYSYDQLGATNLSSGLYILNVRGGHTNENCSILIVD
jgi:peptidylprolyl isomerase